MRSHRVTRDGLASGLRMGLLLTGVLTYLASPDDVVWHFIKTRSHVRLLEHAAFGAAAALLGIALLLKIETRQQDSDPALPAGAAAASLLQAIGIGSLLPLPGFLLLVIGDLGVSTLIYRQQPVTNDAAEELPSRTVGRTRERFRWRGSLVTHLGLCCAFLSMVVFSITLIDRVADVLFAVSALVSLAAGISLDR